METEDVSGQQFTDNKQESLINAVNEFLADYPAYQQLYTLSCKNRAIQRSKDTQEQRIPKALQSYKLEQALLKYQKLQKQTEKDVTLCQHVERLKASVNISDLRKTLFTYQDLPFARQRDVKNDGVQKNDIKAYDVTALAISNEVLLSGLHMPQLPTRHTSDEEFQNLSAKRSFFSYQMQKKAEELINQMKNEGHVEEVKDPENNDNQEISHHSDLRRDDLECETKDNEGSQ